MDVKDYEGDPFCCEVSVVLPDNVKRTAFVNLPPPRQNPQRRRRFFSREQNPHPQILVKAEKQRLLEDAGCVYPPAEELEMVLHCKQGRSVVMNDNLDISEYREDLCDAENHIEIRLRGGVDRMARASHPDAMGYRLKETHS